MRALQVLSIAGVLLVAATLLLGSNADVAMDGVDQKGPPSTDLPKIDPNTPDKIPDKIKDNTDEEMLQRAGLSAEGTALVKFFQKRTLDDSERPAIERLVRQLGSADFRARLRSAQELSSRGPAVLEVLRSAHAIHLELEPIRRVERLTQEIHEKDAPAEVRAAAVRVLALRKPAETVEVLLGYLPFAEVDAVVDEIRVALTGEALVDGKPSAPLLAALTDRAPLRRAVAAEALGRSAFAATKETLHKLLQDPDPLVRFRVAEAFVHARQKSAMPTLIDTIPDLPVNAAWQAESFLQRLAGSIPPPAVAMSNNKNTREKCRAAWQAWWATNGAKIDLAKLQDPPRLLGRTLVILLDENKIVDLGRDNLPRWEVKNLVFPLDAQLVAEDRVLIAEYHAKRVSERNSRGEIIWQVGVEGPLMAQRLDNGNTFIATDSEFIEFGKDGKEMVLNVSVSDEGRRIMKAMKLPSGEIVCMQVDSRIVRYDAKGRELSSFPIEIGMKLFGGRVYVLPNGRVLVPHNAEGKVVEYDAQGKAIWEVPFEQPIAATRLANGNTVITSMNPAVGAVEVDRAGAEVWSYREPTRVTRALRR